jgi:hypothetical protein
LPQPPSNGLPLFTPGFPSVQGHHRSVVPNMSFNGLAAYVTQLTTSFAVPTPTTRFVARGFYNRSSNTFTASSIDVVL